MWVMGQLSWAWLLALHEYLRAYSEVAMHCIPGGCAVYLPIVSIWFEKPVSISVLTVVALESTNG